MNSLRYVTSQVDARFGGPAEDSDAGKEKLDDQQPATIEPQGSLLQLLASIVLFWEWKMFQIFSQEPNRVYSPPPKRPRKRSISGDSAALIRRSILLHGATQQASTKKTLVLDLDETLIHSMTRGRTAVSCKHMIEVQLPESGLSCVYYVARRPYCLEFLDAVSRWYNLVVFTASIKDYADSVIDWLEADLGRCVISRRFYRNDCMQISDGYVKDLGILGLDLSSVILVDNSPISFSLHRYNGIGVEGWISDPSDRVLFNIIPLLNALRQTTDVRSVLCLQGGESAIRRRISSVKEE